MPVNNRPYEYFDIESITLAELFTSSVQSLQSTAQSRVDELYSEIIHEHREMYLKDTYRNIFGMWPASVAQAVEVKCKIFDWDKAAQLIRKHEPYEAAVGLREAWEECGHSLIYRNGEIYRNDIGPIFSDYATPCIDLDGTLVECWSVGDKHSAVRCFQRKWPQPAVDILMAD